MAPVKRSTVGSPKQATRSTRAATVARKTTAAERKAASLPAKPVAPAKSTTAARRVRKPAEDPESDKEEDTSQASLSEETVVKNPRTTRTKPSTGKNIDAKISQPAQSTTTIGRRRVKVTPLDGPNTQNVAPAPQSKSTRSKAKEKESTKTISTRQQRNAAETAGENDRQAGGETEKPKVAKPRKSRTTTAPAIKKEPLPGTGTAAKSRARSKKADKVDHEQFHGPESQPEIEQLPIAARATRSQRAGSTATLRSEPSEAPQSLTTATSRKKVTFQEVPNEDEKENVPLQSRAKKAATTKSVSNKSAAGLKAKPVRKTVTSSITTAPNTKSAAGGRTRVGKSHVDKSKSSTSKSKTVLTPKKITQIAKSDIQTSEVDQLSDGEDELNGGKTPVRDLSVSPRKPSNSVIARALSPAKSLEQPQTHSQRSPQNYPTSFNAESQVNSVLASPARRLPPSPFKDAIKESPKRGINPDATKLLFPAQNEHCLSNPGASPGNSGDGFAMVHLMQSPKRPALLDPAFFSQSAMKTSTSKSPFKSSLFQSPAKRLFSPSKKRGISPTAKISGMIDEQKENLTTQEEDIHSEIGASSHFRPSVSPIRVQRAEVDSSGIDFDQSVLQIGSPLKLTSSPTKSALQAQGIASKFFKPGVGNDEVLDVTLQHSNGGVINPSHLEKTPVVLESGQQDEYRHIDVLSEDELASDVTPVRPGRGKVNGSHTQCRDRDSTVPLQNASGEGLGFTPLAVKVNDWRASSPEKAIKPHATPVQRQISPKFSPLAGEHIEGEIMVSRNSTPVQILNPRKVGIPESRLSEKLRGSTSARKSIPQQELEDFRFNESEEPSTQFEEYMELRVLEQTAEDAVIPNQSREAITNNTAGRTVTRTSNGRIIDGQDETPVSGDEEATTSDGLVLPAELTTDLINFTHASDTAMIDFQDLAREAKELAAECTDRSANAEEQTGPPSRTPDEISLASGDAENVLCQYISSDRVQSSAEDLLKPDGLSTTPLSYTSQVMAPLPVLQATTAALESPSTLNIDGSDSTPVSVTLETQLEAVASKPETETPLQRPKINGPRVVNTVVSKIPLKPEGQVSPIKMKRKRARSFGNAERTPNKRVSFGNLQQGPALPSEDIVQEVSPERRARTSSAPSPGGTSTPANMSERMSIGQWSAVTTPGQMSFAIEDFGESTLDGLDVPEDFDACSPAPSKWNAPNTSDALSPTTGLEVTPTTSKRSNRRATTPATVQKTPGTKRKTPARASAGQAERTPLQPVGQGVLHGAVVFVDVHTSEGSDASSVFVDLLTHMGAQCVKEWRWNPRASMSAATNGDRGAEQKSRITHVLYKDGGKRTLEKVRDAKGEVWCVGVAWVLDCERENRWVDEANYAVDTNVMPRGGSNRRKSMEPKSLQIGTDGSISASRTRRSVSAEMSEVMKRELVDTPARGRRSLSNHEVEDEVDEDLVDHDQATPTGFFSYDPRTATTPGTLLPSKLVQMTAPPKQTNKRLFQDEDDDDEQENCQTSFGMDGSVNNDKLLREAKKFKMKNLDAARRRTLGFRPIIGSPLGRK